MSEDAQRGRVTVYGPDIRKPPLVDSSEPELLLIRDGFGDPMILLVRTMSDDTWGLSTRGDEDFMDQLVKYGFAKLRNGTTPQDMIRKGIGACAEPL